MNERGDVSENDRRSLLQHPMLRLLSCPHRHHRPRSLVHGGEFADGHFVDCGGNSP